MVSKRTTWRNSIFNRLLFVFLLIMIPMYTVGIIIYGLGLDSIRHEYTNSIQTSMDNFLNSFDEDMQRTQMLLFETVVNENELMQLSAAPEDLPQIAEFHRKRQETYNLLSSF